MFTSEGTFAVVITEACTAEPKFAQAPAFDVCLKVKDKNDPSQEDWWRGEVSSRYGLGNFASQTQAEITFNALAKIGFQGGQDYSRIAELVGTETSATTKGSAPAADGKVWYNVRYLGDSGSAPAAIEGTDANSRMQQVMGMIGKGAAAPAAAPAAQPANPFGAGAGGTPATAAAVDDSNAATPAAANPFGAPTNPKTYPPF